MRKRPAIAALLLVVGACRAIAAQTTAGMVPFSMDHRVGDQRAGTASRSLVDMSFLLDAHAGKHGFLRVKSG